MNKAIICIDDERSILNALQQQMMREFEDTFILEFAESAEEALEIISDLQHQNIELALVVTDEMMPGMKGHELIAKISELSNNTPCILLTGYAESEIINSISSSNLAKCISKPWETVELVSTIHEALSSKSMK